jgi:hypothetical protein
LSRGRRWRRILMNAHPSTGSKTYPVVNFSMQKAVMT